MADPITNAQFALGLFQPAVQSINHADSTRLQMALRDADNRRKDALTYWIRSMDREDQADHRAFTDQQNLRQIGAQLAGQDEQTKRIIAQMDATEKRSREAEVRKLYDEYTSMTRDGAKPLEDFGEDVSAQFQGLSKEVGRLKQDVFLNRDVVDLFKKYGALGGKQAVTDFGNTPAEQIQGLSKAIDVESTKHTKNRWTAINNEISSVGDAISKAESLTPEELREAKSEGLNMLNKDAREAYTTYRKSLGEDAALAKVAKLYPDQAEAYRNKVNQTIVGLSMNKRQNDKTVRELYDNLGTLRTLRAKTALDLADQDPDTILGMSGVKPQASTSTTTPGLATAADALNSVRGGSTSGSLAPSQLVIKPEDFYNPLRALGIGGSTGIATTSNPITPATQVSPLDTGGEIGIAKKALQWLMSSPQRAPLSEYEKAMTPSYVPERSGPEVNYSIPDQSKPFGSGWLYSDR